MQCDQLHELLDAYLAGSLGAGERSEVDAHIEQCAECRSVVFLLRDSAGPPVTDDLVVGPVLAATTGRTCNRVRELLAGDPEARPEDLRWAGEHARGCIACTAVLRVLEELPDILPTFASVDPGPDFTAGVLLATLPQPSLWSVFLLRMRDHFARWQRRPEFAQEFSFAVTVALIVVIAVPGSPLGQLPRQALSLIQLVAPGQAESGEITGTVGGQLRLGLRVRSERIGTGFDRLGTHVLGAGRGLVDGDLEMVGENAGQIGCDFQRLWTGVRKPEVDPSTVCG